MSHTHVTPPWDLENTVKDRVSYFFNHNQALREIKALLDRHNLVGYLFGGVIRDLCYSGQPRDLDIIIDGNVDDYEKFVLDFTEKFPVQHENSHEKNNVPSMGTSSLCRMVCGWKADLWHWTKQHTSPKKLEDVIATTFLSAESVLCTFGPDARELKVFDNGFFQMIHSGVLDCRLNCEKFVVPEKYVIKALVIAHRCALSLSSNMQEFLKKHLAEMSVQEFCERQIVRYGHMPLDGAVVFR